ncbi:MAG: YfcC family protein [Actinomycetota bacterium]|nr:YfcC family protein [Actinomycetota bacterium]
MADQEPTDRRADDQPTEGEAPPSEGPRFKFPTALTVLAIVLLVVWIAAFFIPSGVYETDDTGAPSPGSYQELPSCDDVGADVACVDKSPLSMFQILWTATPNGLYGIEDEVGGVQSFNEGFLFGSAEIFLFVIVMGAFISVTMKTGAIELGIKRLALRFRNSPAWLIIILMAVFALGGTTYGMWEETLGFYVLMVALVVAMKLDKMVGVAIIFLGAGTGVLASTVNPFATGVASDAAGIPISDGLLMRVIMWLVLVSVAIAYVLWYAKRISTDPSKSVVGFDTSTEATGETGETGETEDAEETTGTGAAEDVPKMSKRQVWILVVFATAFVIMVYGFIPWDDIWQNMFNTDYPLPVMADLLGDFFFTEASMLFLVAAVIIGAIGGLGEKGTVDTIVAGAGDFLGAALVIVVARGVTVVMKNTFVIDTILNWMEDIVSGTSSIVFSELAFLVNIPIAFLVPSSSGHAALVMPIIAPLADFAMVERALAVTAYQSASGLVNLITPTSAVIMGGLAMTKVGYNKYLKFVGPYLGIIFVLILIFMAVGTALTG